MARLSRRSWFGQVLGGLAAAAAAPELLAGGDDLMQMGTRVLVEGLDRTYTYRVTFSSAAGESIAAAAPSAIRRKLYRTDANGRPLLLATVRDNRTTHYVDGEASP